MTNEKDLMFRVVEKQRDCEFLLKFIIQRENDLWKNFFTMLKLVKKGTNDLITYDYGDFVLGEKLLNIEEGLTAIRNLYPKNGETGKLLIPDYCEFAVDGGSEPYFSPSKHRYGGFWNPHPARIYSCHVEQNKIGQKWSTELLKEGFPYYPNLKDAAIHFFDLTVEHFNSHGEVSVVVLDYRARIESLKLSFSKVQLKLPSPEIEYKDLIVKVFAKSGSKITTLPDIFPKQDSVEFDVGFQPNILTVALMSRQDNMKIDEKEFATWRGEEEEGIFVERQEEEIVSLTKKGESQDLEYKKEINNETERNDFIESVIAFLNTNRGVILIGVDDHGEIAGTHTKGEDILKVIHDSCDPPSREIKVTEKEINGNKIIVVEVPEGDDKPYQSKRDKNWYVRHNGNDMKMERSELIRFLEERKPERSPFIS